MRLRSFSQNGMVRNSDSAMSSMLRSDQVSYHYHQDNNQHKRQKVDSDLSSQPDPRLQVLTNPSPPFVTLTNQMISAQGRRVYHRGHRSETATPSMTSSPSSESIPPPPPPLHKHPGRMSPLTHQEHHQDEMIIYVRDSKHPPGCFSLRQSQIVQLKKDSFLDAIASLLPTQKFPSLFRKKSINSQYNEQ